MRGRVDIMCWIISFIAGIRWPVGRLCGIVYTVSAVGGWYRYGTLLTEQERRMISERRFTDLTQYQRHLDAEIDAQVHSAY